jgi:hypothetical protein
MTASGITAGPVALPISTVPTLRVTFTTFQPSTSYPALGEPITAAQLGLSTVGYAICNVSTATAAIVVGASYDAVNAKVRLWLAGAEATTSTDYSAIRVQIMAFGV